MNYKDKVLFIASWYPSRIHPTAGIFIKHHAEAIAKFCKVFVLYVVPDMGLKDKVYDFEYSIENGIYTLIVYYKRPCRIPLISKCVHLFRLIRGGLKGIKHIEKKHGKPTICHANVALYAGILAIIYKAINKLPFVLTEHSSIYLAQNHCGKKIGCLDKFLLKAITKKADAITTVSSTLKQAMLKQQIYGRYYIVPNVVNTYDLNFQKRSETKLKKKIIQVSRLNDQIKNISGVLKALAKVKDYHLRNDFEFHIIGTGNDRDELKKLARKLNLYNTHVYFHGFQPHTEVIKILEESDFHITNSNYETFSVATAEAIACGIPVVATKCGGPEDFVSDSCGILVEPDNNTQLVDAILYMLDNCNTYDRQKLRSYAQIKFGSEAVGSIFKEIYSIICKNK